MDILSDVDIVGRISVNPNTNKTILIGNSIVCGWGESNGVFTPLIADSNVGDLTIKSNCSINFCSKNGSFNFYDGDVFVNDGSIYSKNLDVSCGSIFVGTANVVFSGANINFQNSNIIIDDKLKGIAIPENCTRFLIKTYYTRIGKNYPLVTAYKDRKKVDLDIEMVVCGSDNEKLIGSMTACSSGTYLHISVL